MTETSIGQAVVAVGACLIHLRRLVDACKPPAPWLNVSPDPQQATAVFREVGPRLMKSFSQLQACKSDALRELLKVRNRLTTRGVTVRQEPVIALGTSGRFALDIACEKIEEYVGFLETTISEASVADPDWIVKLIGLLEDTTTKEWTAFLQRLELEVRDTTAVLAGPSHVGKPEAVDHPAPAIPDNSPGKPAATGIRRHSEKCHSPDFSEVTWHGKRYRFTPNQARAVKILWSGWETGGATVRGQYIVETLDIGSSQTLARVFRCSDNSSHMAWGELIVPARGIRGAYCLNDPDDPAMQVAAEEKSKQSGPGTGKRIGKRTEKRTGKRKK